MKKFLKIASVAIGFMLLLIIAALLAVWFFPGLVINDTTLRMAQGRLQKFGVAVDARKSSLSAHSASFWKKNIRAEFENVCLTLDPKHPPICLKELKLNADVSLRKFRLYGLRVNELWATADEIRLDLTGPATPPETSPKKSSSSFPWFNTELGVVVITVPMFKVVQGKDEFTGKFFVNNHGSEFHLDALVNSRLGTMFKNAQAKVNGPLLHKLGDILVPHEALVTAQLPARRSVRLDMHGEAVTADVDKLTAKAELRDPQMRLNLDLDLNREGRKIRLATRGAFRQTALPAPLRIEGCTLNATLPDGESSLPVEAADLNCDFAMHMKDLPIGKNYLANLPATVGAHLTASVKPNPSAEEELIGKVGINMGPLLNSFAKLDLNANYDIKYRSGRDNVLEPVKARSAF